MPAIEAVVSGEYNEIVFFFSLHFLQAALSCSIGSLQVTLTDLLMLLLLWLGLPGR